MANLPISGLTASASNAAATDVLPVVQTTGTGPVKMTVQQIAGGLLGSTTLTGATVTTSQPVLDLAQTWNASGVTFTGLKFNVASDTSAAASLLMDLQVGASSRFQVRKDGRTSIGNLSTFSHLFSEAGNIIGVYGGQQRASLTLQGGDGWDAVFTLQNNGSLILSGAGTTYLGSPAANTLRLGLPNAATPFAQTLSVQSRTGTDAAATAYPFTITGAQGTGTGAGGSIVFQVAPAGGTSNAVQNALTNALRIIPGTPLSGTDTNSAIYPGISNNVYISSPFNYGIELNCSGNNGYAVALNGGTTGAFIGGSGPLAWSSTVSQQSRDLFLYRDDANKLALRNSTAAQTFNIYNTYTSSTSYERYSVDWITTANLVIVGPNKGSGGGTQRVQRLSYLEDGGAGSTVPLLGSTCPAASGTVKSWIKIITSDGTTAYVPCWA